MRTQKIQNRQPSALQGVGLVLLVALAAVAGSLFFTRLEARLGRAASLLFILYGCAIAWFLLNWYGMSFIYTATDDCLRLCRAYGKRERFMADVWLNQVVAYGTPEEMKARYADAPVTRALRSQCEYPPLALAYKEGGRIRVALLQPDEAMKKHLIDRIKGYMK